MGARLSSLSFQTLGFIRDLVSHSSESHVHTCESHMNDAISSESYALNNKIFHNHST